MEDFKVNAVARSQTGKGAMRRMRSEGLVPAVLYGGNGEPANISVRSNELIKHLESEAFHSHILTIELDGKAQQAVLKSVQRHPASTDVIHVDFLRVDATHEIRMTVPLHFVNEETSPGRKAGGMVTHAITEVDVSCLPKDLPEFIEVDLGGLNVGDSLHMSAIRLPSGVSLLAHVEEADHDHVVASIQEMRSVESEDSETGEDAEGGAS